MPAASTLASRVRRLERLVLILTIALVAMLATVVLGARSHSQTEDLVQARQIQLVDHAGRIRMDLRHDSTETGLFILDTDGDTRVGVAQFAHGGGGIALHGPRAKGAAVLYLKDGGSLSIYDTTGARTARFPAEDR